MRKLTKLEMIERAAKCAEKGDTNGAKFWELRARGFSAREIFEKIRVGE